METFFGIICLFKGSGIDWKIAYPSLFSTPLHEKITKRGIDEQCLCITKQFYQPMYKRCSKHYIN